MMGVNTAEILDVCLQRLASGDSLEKIIADYPERAGELRELLRIAASAQPPENSLRVSQRAQRDSRRLMLAQAKKLEGRRPAFSPLDFVRFFRAHLGTAAAVSVMVVLLIVALGSTNALPGDGLYPIKLAAEEAGIILGSNDAGRLEREAGLDTSQAEAVQAMIRDGQAGAVQFAGFLNRSPLEGWQAAGIRLDMSSEIETQAGSLSGIYVEIDGMLTSMGRVEVRTLAPRVFTLRGEITEINGNQWQVGSQSIRLNASTQTEGEPVLGSEVTVEAARVVGSEQMLALRIMEAAAQPQITPSASPTISPSPTSPPTAMPSATPAPTRTQAPVILLTAAPTDDHGGDDSGDHDSEKDDNGDDSGGGSGNGGGDDDNGGSDNEGSGSNSGSGKDDSGSDGEH